MQEDTTPPTTPSPEHDESAVLQPVASELAKGDNSLSEATSNPEKSFETIQAPATPPPAPSRQRAAPARPGILEGDNELTQAVAAIRKQDGHGSIVTADKLPSFNQITTGVFALDYALMGGIHVGLSHQIYGWENAGKTSMLLRIMRSHQERYPDKAIVFVPLEGTFDPEHAIMFGVDLSRVLVIQPSSGEAAIDEIIALYKAEQTGAIFLDSVPALVPKAIIEKSAEDKTMSEAARLGTILYQKILEALWNERRRGHFVSFFATNQWRMNPGKMFGDPRYLPGGNFQKFFYTNFIEVKSKEAKGEDATGQQVLSQLDQGFHIEKAKVGACIIDGDFKTVISPNHPSGLKVGDVDDAAVVATIAKKHGFIYGGGGTWRVDGVKKNAVTCRKLDEIQAWLYANPIEFLALKQRVIADLRRSRGRSPFPPDGHLLNKPKAFQD